MSSSNNVEWVAIVVVLVIIVVTAFSLLSTAFYFYSLTLGSENARSLFDKIVDIDGVLLGFVAVVIGITATKIKLRVEVLLAAVVPPVVFCLLSIRLSLLGIATVAISGTSFVLPISLMIVAAAVFFGTLAMIGYETR